MSPRRVAIALGMLATVLVCGRLGLWQVARMHEKERLRDAFDSTLNLAPTAIAPLRYPAAHVGRRVIVTGTYETGRHILLSARSHDGEVGVGVVTPLLLPDGRAVLVDRGWLPAADAITADPMTVQEPGLQRVVGIARVIPATTLPTRWMLLPTSRAVVWSTYALSRDSLAERVPYPLLDVIVEQLPGEGVPPQPRRGLPERPDPSIHFWYAVQWFVVAGIVAIGGLWVARRGGEAARAAAARGG